jgi:hypothetical protein
VFGTKESTDWAPTVTWKLAADAEVAAATATRVEARVKCIFKIFFFVVLSMDVRWNRSSKAGLKGQRSCGNIEGLARTVKREGQQRE